MEQTRYASELVDHFFRNEFGKAVSYLTAKFGPTYLGEAEDAVQDALMKAMQTWPFGKIPDNPTAWIIRVAKNKLIDQIRRKQKVYYTTRLPDINGHETIISEEFFQDEIVKMMFACCNPKLNIEYQMILTLRLLGGLSVKEIASALIKKEEAVAKALTRAKKKFQKENLRLEIPSEAEIKTRLQVVLKIIYLLFNEGYKSTEGDHLIRRDICEEAMRLNQILLEKKETNDEWSRSLMALMHFQASKFDSRTDEAGEGVSLEFQDRTKWDHRHINLGNRYLNSVQDGIHNTYFLQAAISGIHANAKTYEESQWPSILKLYDHLYALSPNPIIALNRIIPLAKIEGEAKALNQLQELEHEKSLSENYLLPAIKAELYIQLGQKNKAIKELQVAIEKTDNAREKAFLKKKMDSCLN